MNAVSLFPGWLQSLGRGGARRGTCAQVNFLLCRQVDMISVRLLREVLGSAAAMTIFSVRHRSHLLDPHL